MSNPPTHYECDRCGLCCRKLIVYLVPADVVREPRLATVAIKFRQSNEYSHHLCAGRCPLLNGDSECTIYETRPTECREYEAGAKHCQDLRELYGFPPLLPHLPIVEAGPCN